MRFPRSVLVVCLSVAVTSLAGCGRVSEHTPKPSPKVEMNTKSQHVNVRQAPDRAQLQTRRNDLRRLRAFLLGAAQTRVQPATTPDLVSTDTIPATPVVSVAAPSSSIDWPCVAEAETGSDFSMHGSSYSSAYGVMNEAVRENAPPDVAARILAGTASPAEQLAMAESIAARHGLQAWAPSTYERCSR